MRLQPKRAGADGSLPSVLDFFYNDKARGRPLAPSPRRLGEERLHRLGVERAHRDHDRRVEAREPDLRADEVDVQRVGQRVDEAADEEERRELGWL